MRSGFKDISRCRNEIIKQVAQIAFPLIKGSVFFIERLYSLQVVLSRLEGYMNVSGIKPDCRMVEGSNKHAFAMQH
ncbi:MAG TPA: hypothetical protein VF172_10280 [Nitrososphaera sp.]|jgi:hypothetical protein